MNTNKIQLFSVPSSSLDTTTTLSCNSLFKLTYQLTQKQRERENKNRNKNINRFFKTVLGLLITCHTSRRKNRNKNKRKRKWHGCESELACGDCLDRLFLCDWVFAAWSPVAVSRRGTCFPSFPFLFSIMYDVHRNDKWWEILSTMLWKSETKG